MIHGEQQPCSRELRYHFIMEEQERFRYQTLDPESATWELPVPRLLRVEQMGRTGEATSFFFFVMGPRLVELNMRGSQTGWNTPPQLRSDFQTILMGYTNLALQKIQDPTVPRPVVHPHSLHISFYSKSNIFIFNTNLNNL